MSPGAGGPPSHVNLPSSGWSNPAISRSSVDFPHPEGPSRATKSASDSRSEASRKASMPPGKRRPTPPTVSTKSSMLQIHPDLMVHELQGVGFGDIQTLRIHTSIGSGLIELGPTV